MRAEPHTHLFNSKPDPAVLGRTALGNYDLVHALRWYNNNVGDPEVAKYLKTDLNTAAQFRTLAYGLMLQEAGFSIPANSRSTINQMQQNFDSIQTSKVSEGPKESVADRIKKKAEEICGWIEDELESGKVSDWYEWLSKNEVGAQHVKYIWSFELDMPTELVKALERLKDNAKATRKPRKRRVLDPEKATKGLKYLKESKEFKLVSVAPERLIGASEVWVFNVKLRSLALYVPEEHATLQLKGSTLKFFDKSKSYSKTIRKPDEFFGDFLGLTDSKARKKLEEIKAVGKKLQGRINKDCVIVRVK